MGLVPKKSGAIAVHGKAKMGGPADRQDEPAHGQKKASHGGRTHGTEPKRGGDIRVHDAARMGDGPDQAAGQASGDIQMVDPRQPGGLMERGAPPTDQNAPDPDPRYTDDSDGNVSPEEQAMYDKFMDNALKLIYKPDGSTVLDGVLQALSKDSPAPAAPAAPPQVAPAPAPGDPGAMANGGLMAQASDVAAAPDPNAGPPQAMPPQQPGGLMNGEEQGETQPESPSQERAEEGGQSMGSQPPQIVALANLTVTIVSKLDDSATQAGKPIPDDVLLHGGADVMSELAEVAEAAGIHDYTDDELQGAMTTALDMYRQKAITEGRTDENTLKTQWEDIMMSDKEGRLGDAVPALASKKQEA